MGALGLHRLEGVLAGQELAENDVLAVEPVRVGDANEELRAVGVGASVGHGQAAEASVLAANASKGLVLKLGAVDRLAARAVVVGEVAT